jgi:hypothetical protein
MSDDPEVIRGPHGIWSTDSPTTLPARPEPEVFDPSKHPERAALVEDHRRESLLTEEARRADPMPDPGAPTVGEMIDFIKGNRRDAVPSKSLGWKAFLAWQAGPHRRSRPISPGLKAALDLDARLRRRRLVGAADGFLIQLGERTGKPTREIERMPLRDAVRLLDRSSVPEAASAPAAPPPPGDRTAAEPARTGSDGESRGDRQGTDVAAEPKRTRRPRRC